MGITKKRNTIPVHGARPPHPLHATRPTHRPPEGYSVTIINTPSNIRTLRASLPSTSSVHLVDLTSHGGPENTDAITHDQFFRFLQSSESLRPALRRLLSDAIAADPTHPPCLITDTTLGWTVEVAEERGVFHAFFLTSGAYGSAVFHSLWTQRPYAWTDSDELALPNRPDIKLHRSQVSPMLLHGDDEDSGFMYFRRQIILSSNSSGILINTAKEFERVGVEFLEAQTGTPIWPIGPILRMPKKSTPSDAGCVAWLNQHAEASVLYVSFGSENAISASQMMELAMGLEASETVFMWVVRPPVGFDFKGEFRAEEWLPEGFEERMRERNKGMLIRGWAPQLEILSHTSMGGFLSHCGWNSVIESLSNGVPMIGWPLGAEQYYNSKMMVEEIGVCVEVARGSESMVERGHIESTIRSVMDGGMGREMRRKAREIGKVLREAVGEGGASVRAMDEFLVKAFSNKPPHPLHATRPTHRPPKRLLRHRRQHPLQHPHPPLLPPIHLVDLTTFSGPENTDAITHDEFYSFFQSIEPSIRPSFRRFVSDAIAADPDNPPCIISDAVLGWTVEVAEELGVFHAFFLPIGAYGSAIFHSLWTQRPYAWTDSDELVLPNRPNIRVHRTQVNYF
ncbi:UDP-glycosyltransferase 92A1 [Acorus calamus]|uniref:UDP-glycosyltransferase 92A1 n=1 Tax=Acorus calamus TaxID=4465 RepID=A0AAV9E5V4_ACOCL|nr:UDP-glycosyltransferase 92A1 [Acorus calamus]